ncbi:hypothetical protein ACG33_14065 [Steroidobacter denitrificans]|uniref:Mechanosensitive ion channel protein MscS n=1 Tax=Steroidobacter denitrificans TaxID=465721 RepID=A0A127FCT8_STEDE|nr:hypothetical protein ACG33_14065 [Steroidobacter denitrificans]
MQWGAFVIIATMALLTLLLIRRLVRNRHAVLAATAEIEFAERFFQIASRTSSAFLAIVSVYAGLLALKLPENAYQAIHTAFTIAVFWQTGLWASTAVLAAVQRRRRGALKSDQAAASSLGIIGFVARLTIWSLVLLLTLDNLGIQIKSLLAGLGIGGIAVALAAQNILGDLFASLSITLDRPFVVGDALQVDEFSGTVEYIGVKSTRLRSVSGEQIIIPNANLLSSRIRNNARLRERRVIYTLSVDQLTSHEQLRRLPGILRELIESHRDVRFDRAHFARIGSSSFDIEAVYIVTTPNYGRHMDILQDIHLRLLDIMGREGISLAQPSQKLYMQDPAPHVSTELQLVAAEESRSAATDPAG